MLASLEAQSHTRAQNLERLKSQQAGLEKLLRELRAALERFPVEGNDAFARLRGKLAWPVSGHLVARFGESRAGGVRWDGVLVATERGTPVKAVCAGRVIYADWLPGLGLLRHRRPRRWLPEPLRPQRAPLQGGRRAGGRRGHPRGGRRYRRQRAPGAVFRDPQGAAGRWIRAPGSGPRPCGPGGFPAGRADVIGSTFGRPGAPVRGFANSRKDFGGRDAQWCALGS